MPTPRLQFAGICAPMLDANNYEQAARNAGCENTTEYFQKQSAPEIEKLLSCSTEW